MKKYEIKTFKYQAEGLGELIKALYRIIVFHAKRVVRDLRIYCALYGSCKRRPSKKTYTVDEIFKKIDKDCQKEYDKFHYED